MRVSFRESFAKDLRKIRNRDLLSRIKEAIEQIENSQNLGEVPGLKSLKGAKGYYRLRVGDYRIGLTVQGDVIAFVRCLNRNEIYRYFP